MERDTQSSGATFMNTSEKNHFATKCQEVAHTSLQGFSNSSGLNSAKPGFPVQINKTALSHPIYYLKMCRGRSSLLCTVGKMQKMSHGYKWVVKGLHRRDPFICVKSEHLLQ